jgi:hypothetical protein
MKSLFRSIIKQKQFISFDKFFFCDKKIAVTTGESKIPEFMKYNDKTPKQHEEFLKKAKSDILYNYGSMRRADASATFNKVEFLAKRMRHAWFKLGDVYHSHKHVIPVKRLRTKEETLFKLLSQGEIACTLQGREEFDEIHFVLDKKYAKHLEG